MKHFIRVTMIGAVVGTTNYARADVLYCGSPASVFHLQSGKDVVASLSAPASMVKISTGPNSTFNIDVTYTKDKKKASFVVPNTGYVFWIDDVTTIHTGDVGGKTCP